MNDQTAFMGAMLAMIADATPVMLDALGALFAAGLACNDFAVFQDQLATTWGIIVGTESLVMADALLPSLQWVIALALVDSDVANWLDAVLATMVFSPGNIVMASLAVLGRIIASLQVEPEVDAFTVNAAPKMGALDVSAAPEADAFTVSVEPEA